MRSDVLVIGGGHNGLVTAGLLAKRGLTVTVLERRDVVGGAAITETPWGPDYKMTALSYVVSLMPPTVTRELELERFGYKVYPTTRRAGTPRSASSRRAMPTRWSGGTTGSAGSARCSGRC